MSVEELNGKYLRVGYRRRVEDAVTGQRTAKGRPVMGRKGLGKLSLFSIADVIEVQTAKDGTVHGLRMCVSGIQQAVKNKQPYHPTELLTAAPSIERGTKIVLRDIKRQRLGKGVTALRKRLARRFSIIVKRADSRSQRAHPSRRLTRRSAESSVLWTVEGTSRGRDDARKVGRCFGAVRAWDTWRVEGWLGTARKPRTSTTTKRQLTASSSSLGAV